MEAQQAPPKREWPKWYWGPDLRQARFDSPSDIPRDYFPTLDEARAYVERKHEAVAVPAAATASPDIDPEYAEFQAWKKKSAALALARAAKAAKAE